MGATKMTYRGAENVYRLVRMGDMPLYVSHARDLAMMRHAAETFAATGVESDAERAAWLWDMVERLL